MFELTAQYRQRSGDGNFSQASVIKLESIQNIIAQEGGLKADQRDLNLVSDSELRRNVRGAEVGR
jgi:hypothetical protein